MPKRFTDTTKWDDDWYFNLNNEEKLAWVYILDTCDHAGIWKKNLRLLNFNVNSNFQDDDLKRIFFGKFIEIKDKWFIPNFIKFQYGKQFLTSKNSAVISARELLLDLGFIQDIGNNIITVNQELLNPNLTLKQELPNPYLTLNEPLPNPYPRVKEKEKDKSEDMSKDTDEFKNTDMGKSEDMGIDKSKVKYEFKNESKSEDVEEVTFGNKPNKIELNDFDKQMLIQAISNKIPHPLCNIALRLIEGDRLTKDEKITLTNAKSKFDKIGAMKPYLENLV